jgi:Hydrazine synthase alpha subunit middle domain
VDERKSTGTLLCLNVRNSRNTAVAEAKPSTIRTVRVLAVDGQLLGEDSVEADGSFFVEVPADQPLRLELRGPEGVVAADHSGLWVRPNENRGCIGCHEDPEVAPENRVVQAVDKGQAPARATAQLVRSEKR